MLSSDNQVQINQERINYYEKLLLQLRTTTTAQQYNVASAAYIAEINKLHNEIVHYLKTHPQEIIRASRSLVV